MSAERHPENVGDQITYHLQTGLHSPFPNQGPPVQEYHQDCPGKGFCKNILFTWVLQTTPDRLIPCVNRVVSETSPKWKLHQHPTNSFGSGIMIMRPRALLGSTLSHLLVQYTSLPDGYLDVRAAMVKDILSDPDPNYPARVRANVNESMQDFAKRLNEELKPLLPQPTLGP